MNERFNKALIFASEAHCGQIRKSENIPYIIHPMEVATIISSITNDEDVVIAGLLHDTVEDTEVELCDIEELFGSDVAMLVKSETENKYSDMPPEETWKLRKTESLDELKNANDIRIKILWLADKLSNIRTIYRKYREIGVKAFDVFHQKDIKEQEWYYRSAAELLSELKETAAYEEYELLINKVFN